MTTRQQKIRLRQATWALVLPTAFVTAWSVFWPIDTQGTQTQDRKRMELGGTHRSATETESGKQTSMKTNWNRKLRLWQFETPAETAPFDTPPQPESATGLRLVGTVLEPGATYAMIADQSGTIDLQPEGGVLAIEPSGVRVESISARRVVINYRGVSETLSLESLPVGMNQSHASNGSQESPRVDMDSESTAPENLDDELDWLNGEPPMQASPAPSQEK